MQGTQELGTRSVSETRPKNCRSDCGAALVTTSRIVMRSLPLHAPQLKLIFCTNAGMNLLAGADLPKDVVVLNNSGAHSDKAGE